VQFWSPGGSPATCTYIGSAEQWNSYQFGVLLDDDSMLTVDPAPWSGNCDRHCSCSRFGSCFRAQIDYAWREGEEGEWQSEHLDVELGSSSLHWDETCLWMGELAGTLTILLHYPRQWHINFIVRHEVEYTPGSSPCGTYSAAGENWNYTMTITECGSGSQP
jgi:hypothetical protein